MILVEQSLILLTQWHLGQAFLATAKAPWWWSTKKEEKLAKMGAFALQKKYDPVHENL